MRREDEPAIRLSSKRKVPTKAAARAAALVLLPSNHEPNLQSLDLDTLGGSYHAVAVYSPKGTDQTSGHQFLVVNHHPFVEEDDQFDLYTGQINPKDITSNERFVRALKLIYPERPFLEKVGDNLKEIKGKNLILGAIVALPLAILVIRNRWQNYRRIRKIEPE